MTTSCDFDSIWIEERIAKTKLLIIAYEDAMLGLASGAIYSYSLNTGQTQQTVTKANMSTLRAMVDALENRLSTLQARLCGAGIYVRPAF